MEENNIATQNKKISVYDYLDYQSYLRDHVFNSSKMSLGAISKRASGISKSYLSLVLNNKRNISLKKVLTLGRAIGLKERELNYFEIMVRFNLAKINKEKEYYLNQLVVNRPPKIKTSITSDQYNLLRNWHCMVIRELVRLPGFQEDENWISLKLKKRLTPKEAKIALGALINTNMLVRNQDGKLIPADRFIKTPDEVRSVIIQQYHKSCLANAALALEDPLETREFGSVNLVLSSEMIKKVKEMTKKYQEEIVRLTSTLDEKSMVCQLNIQFFTLSK